MSCALIGTVAASGQGDTWEAESWQTFVTDYQEAFAPEDRFPSPSLLATNYYGAALATLTSLAAGTAIHEPPRATLKPSRPA